MALVLTWVGVPALPFALGMFIPLQLNLPLLVGGLVSWYVGSRSKDERLNKARREKGTLLASGFIAGGALMGVVSAMLKMAKLDLFLKTWQTSPWSHVLTIVMYAAIIYFLVRSSKSAKVENED